MTPRARPDLGNPIRRLQLAVAALLSILLVGTLGFMWMGGAKPIDALLMTVISISTVGYEEVVPLDAPGIKVFAIGLILSAVFVGAWAVTSVAELIFAEYFWTYLGRQRMQSRIDKLTGHIILCGFGRMGRAVASELEHESLPFVVIELSPEREGWVLEAGHLFILDDATHDDTLIRAGIDRASALIAVTGSDAVNLMIVLSARNLRPRLRIAARADVSESIQKLYHAGADYVLHHHGTGALHLALSVTNPVVEDVLNRLLPRAGNLDFGQLYVDPDDQLVGRTLADLQLSRYDALVMAIARGEQMMLPPPVFEPLQEGDILVVAGTEGALQRLRHVLDE